MTRRHTPGGEETRMFTKKRVIAVLAIAATALVVFGPAIARAADSWN